MRIAVGLLCIALAAPVATVAAQSWTPEQHEVWRFEEQMWKLIAAKDMNWISTMVHPNVSAWSNGDPAPFDLASITRWHKAGLNESTTLEQELFPVSIKITGNTAVVQYRFKRMVENLKKEHKTVTGRWTDVLVKENGKWLFIAWVGGDDPEK